jgi:hypothetical protein
VAQENITLNLKASIDTGVVERDLQKWDAQEKILKNTGIERDGGITNLYAEVESNSQYDETFYASNGHKVQLSKDVVNDNFRVLADGKDLGRCPLWGVKSRSLIPADASDVLATVDGTYLILRLLDDVASIEEVDASFERIRIRSFTVHAGTFTAALVRNESPTWANVTSIVIGYLSGTSYYYAVELDSTIEYLHPADLGLGAISAWYKNGWIFNVRSFATNKSAVIAFRSTGAADMALSGVSDAFLTADYTPSTGVISFKVACVQSGIAATWYTFTPPSAPSGGWSSSSIVRLTTNSIISTYGGIGVAYLSGIQKYTYINSFITKDADIYHTMPPEIYGIIDSGASVIIKEHTIGGQGSYLSMSFAHDAIGVPITEIGELSNIYSPQLLKKTGGDYVIIYQRGDGSFASVIISKDLTFTRMVEISSGVVKINTASAICLMDTTKGDLEFSGNAFNGFVIVAFNTVAPSTKAYIARHRGAYGGSVDTNYKNAGSVGAVTSVEIVEGRLYTPANDAIDVYVGAPPNSLNYYRSIRGYTAQFIDNAKNGTIYVDDLVIPPPAGAIISDRTIQLIGTTAIREPEYDGYQLANETKGLFESFSLYGTLYLFDGQWIRSANLLVNVLQSLTRVARAQGLQFLAESPQAIYFLSDFDNSIFIFDGGQAVTKMDRYSRKEPILDAAYSVKENTLALFTSDTVMFVRDGGIVGQINLPFVAPFTAFATIDGLWISKGTYSIRYLYNPVMLSALPITVTIDGGIWGTAYADTIDGGVWGTAYPDTIDGGVWGDGSQIVPLVWQSKFNGYSERNTQFLERVMFRFYKEDSAPVDIVIDYMYFDEAGQHSESRTVTLGDVNHPYDALGYAFLEYIPTFKQSIGFSIQITCPTKIVYLDVIAKVGLHAESTINSR